MYLGINPLLVFLVPFIFTMGLTWDFMFCIKFWVLPLALHAVLTSSWCRTIVRSRIYFSPLYGFPGVNVIEDKTSPTYDPYGSTLSTLIKVSSDVKLEDSGAWLNIIKLLRSKRSVKQLLQRQKDSVKPKLVEKHRGLSVKPNRSGAIKK